MTSLCRPSSTAAARPPQPSGSTCRAPVVSRYLAELEAWAGAAAAAPDHAPLQPDAGRQRGARRSCRQMLELARTVPVAAASTGRQPARPAAHHREHLVRRRRSWRRRDGGFRDAQPAASRSTCMLLDRTVNLVDERIDLAIRISNDLDPNLIARPPDGLPLSDLRLAGLPAQRTRTPRRVEDLSLHNCLTHSYFGKSSGISNVGGEPASGAGQRQHQRQRIDRARCWPREAARAWRCCRPTSPRR